MQQTGDLKEFTSLAIIRTARSPVWGWRVHTRKVGLGVTHATDHVPALVQRLYSIVQEFESHFPGRSFTPDGHLVGSIGEVLAAHRYGLELLPCSTEGHDARDPHGRHVQIKATQGSAVAMRSCCEHLIVLRLLRDGSAEDVYNGPGSLAWNAAGSMQKNGQRSISLSKLRSLMEGIPEVERLPLAL